MSSSVTSRLPVLVLFNHPSPHTRGEDRAAEVGVLDTVGLVTASLTRAGFSAETFGIGDDWLPLAERLRRDPALVLNFCEGFAGRATGEAHVASLLELLGVPYTGSGPDAMLLCLHKIRAKRLLAGCGLPTPAYLEFQAVHAELPDRELAELQDARGITWPAMVKPAAEDASQGVRQDAVARSIGELRTVTARTSAAYGFPVLVEQYVPGDIFR
jgi:D-alanine-D-alanine ligase